MRLDLMNIEVLKEDLKAPGLGNTRLKGLGFREP